MGMSPSHDLVVIAIAALLLAVVALASSPAGIMAAGFCLRSVAVLVRATGERS